MQKTLKNYNKVGVLGGTFDPPHIGHLYISKIAIKKLKLSKLLWVITKKNPLKKRPHLKIKTRIKLAKKIIDRSNLYIEEAKEKSNDMSEFFNSEIWELDKFKFKFLSILYSILALKLFLVLTLIPNKGENLSIILT